MHLIQSQFASEISFLKQKPSVSSNPSDKIVCFEAMDDKCTVITGLFPMADGSLDG